MKRANMAWKSTNCIMYEPSSVNLLDLTNSFSSQQNLQNLKTYEFTNTDTSNI